MKLELTIDEANALIGLIDIAVKTGGLQVAPTALAMVQKLKEAAEKKDSE